MRLRNSPAKVPVSVWLCGGGCRWEKRLRLWSDWCRYIFSSEGGGCSGCGQSKLHEGPKLSYSHGRAVGTEGLVLCSVVLRQGRLGREWQCASQYKPALRCGGVSQHRGAAGRERNQHSLHCLLIPKEKLQPSGRSVKQRWNTSKSGAQDGLASCVLLVWPCSRLCPEKQAPDVTCGTADTTSQGIGCKRAAGARGLGQHPPVGRRPLSWAHTCCASV